MRSLVQMSVLFALPMLIILSQIGLSEAKIVHKVIAGIAIPVMAGAGAGLAGGVVAGAVTGAHRDRGYRPPSTTYYTTYERSYLARPRPQPSPLLRHLRKAIQYSFEHRRPPYASWLSAHAAQHYLRPAHAFYQTTHSYHPSHHSKSSYHKAVYSQEEPQGHTASVDSQIECKVVTEDVSQHRKPSVEVPPHEEEAHIIYKPKGHGENVPTKVVHEHHYYHDDEVEVEQEERNLTDKKTLNHYKGSKKHDLHNEEETESHHHHDEEDLEDDPEDSFARRRAIRRKNKRKSASNVRPKNGRNDRRLEDSKRTGNKE